MKKFLLFVLVASILLSAGAVASSPIATLLLPTGNSVQIVCEGEDVAIFVEKQDKSGLISCLVVLPTPTPEPTVVLPTVTPSPTQTPPVMPTGTPTSVVTPLPSVGVPVTVNVPFVEAPNVLPLLDANSRAVVWAGKMSPIGGYGQLRLTSDTSGVYFYTQIMTPTLSSGGSFTLKIGNFLENVRHGSPARFTYSSRCTGDACRGWGASGLIPWSEIGPVGESVDFRFIVPNGEVFGTLNFGLPDYLGSTIVPDAVFTATLKQDAVVGGGTDCAADNDPNNNQDPVTGIAPDYDFWWKTWGSENVGFYGDKIINMGNFPWAIAQNQWDIADWPCYAKYIFEINEVALPVGAQVISATLNVYHFGDPGYGSGYAPDGTKDTIFQIYPVKESWSEDTVTWDNFPTALENISWTMVKPREVCEAAGSCWEQFDVTELYRRNQLSAIMYTAAGQYHSGKQFYSSEGALPPFVTLGVKLPATPTPVLPTATSTPFPPTPTVTPTPVIPVIFDDFNRQILGDNWRNLGGYILKNNALALDGSTALLWQNLTLTGTQRVTVTFEAINTSAREIAIVLASNSDASKLIEMVYSPKSTFCQPWTFSGSWTPYPSVPCSFSPGDSFSASLDQNGVAAFYKNGIKLGEKSIEVPYTGPAYVGLWGLEANETIVDNFQAVGIVNNTQPTPSPTVTPIIVLPTLTPAPPTTTPVAGSSKTYYVSKTGSDSNSGTSLTQAWATFKKAWPFLMPGDTLLIGDGVYTQNIAPDIRSGLPGKPITIKALNDGKVTIDCNFQCENVRIGDNWGPNGNAATQYYVVEGLVLLRGNEAAVRVLGDNNIFKRISAYDINTNTNSKTFLIWGNNNLVEDSVAAGSGRYMFITFDRNNNTFRRVFSMWGSWDGKNFCGVEWPNGNNIGVYNSNNTIVENSIAYGRALTGVLVQANHDAVSANNNKILGTMSLLQGRDYNGSVWNYDSSNWPSLNRPGPTFNPYGAPCDDNIIDWNHGYARTGFSVWGQGTVKDNIFRDILAISNVGTGLSAAQPYENGAKSNNVIDYATMLNNGADIPSWEAAQGGNIAIRMSGINNPTNSKIANSPWNNGEGARFQYRYEDGVLTNIPLLPWPMEERIKSELGISVNEVITTAIKAGNGESVVWPVPTR